MGKAVPSKNSTQYPVKSSKNSTELRVKIVNRRKLKRLKVKKPTSPLPLSLLQQWRELTHVGRGVVEISLDVSEILQRRYTSHKTKCFFVQFCNFQLSINGGQTRHA